MLDTHQLNVFVVAADTLNFTQAARRLHMTQPSVTQHMQALEQHFGQSLFIRSGHHLTLTEAGTALLPLARDMVGLSIRADELMESLKGDVYGHLVVGCSTTPGKYILPRLLASFMRRYPKVNATCNIASRRNALQWLAEGKVGVALSSSHEFSGDVEFRKLISDPIRLIVPLTHPWAKRKYLQPKELQEGVFILREEESGTYCVVRDGLARLGVRIEDLGRVLTLGNSEAIGFAVLEGIGVGFVSEQVARQVVGGRVAEVKVKGLDLVQDIYVARNWRIPATRVQTAFWDFVTDPVNAPEWTTASSNG
jgi:DNA-binding transcriptional LysR family regulator